MKKKIDEYLSSPIVLKYLKMGGVVIGGIAAIYLLGHVFKITAHTVNGYNQLKNALKNGNQNI